MKVVIDGNINDEDEFLSVNNRAFQFGDGVFETLLVHKNQIRFIEDHHSRLVDAMNSISLESTSFDLTNFQNAIHSSLDVNGLKSGRVKYMVYRKSTDIPGYRTNTNEIETCVIVNHLINPQVLIHENVGLSKKVILNHSPFSAFKTMSSLPYVIAEIEKSERDLHELIINDTSGNVSECCSSNIFWIIDNQLYTPPLTTGCKAGIMRKQIMKTTDVIEQNIASNELLKAETVFCTNIAKLGIFESIEGHKLSTSHPIIDQIKPLWELL